MCFRRGRHAGAQPRRDSSQHSQIRQEPPPSRRTADQPAGRQPGPSVGGSVGAGGPVTDWKGVKAARSSLRILRTVESCSATRDVGPPFISPDSAAGGGGGGGRRWRGPCIEPLGGSKMKCREQESGFKGGAGGLSNKAFYKRRHRLLCWGKVSCNS